MLCTLYNYLFQLEDSLVECVLDALVGVVDAELLKAVLREVLEAEEVQDGDDVALLAPAVLASANAVQSERKCYFIERNECLLL